MLFYRLTDTTARSVGVHCLQTDDHNLNTYMTYVDIVSYFIVAGYTVLNNIIGRQFDKACYPLCTSGACTFL